MWGNPVMGWQNRWGEGCNHPQHNHTRQGGPKLVMSQLWFGKLIISRAQILRNIYTSIRVVCHRVFQRTLCKATDANNNLSVATLANNCMHSFLIATRVCTAWLKFCSFVHCLAKLCCKLLPGSLQWPLCCNDHFAASCCCGFCLHGEASLGGRRTALRHSRIERRSKGPVHPVREAPQGSLGSSL